jgi:phospholipase C
MVRFGVRGVLRGVCAYDTFLCLAHSTHHHRCSDGPTALCLKEMRTKRNLLKYRPLESFYKECASGHLPHFSWIDPAYFGIPDVQKPTDQHPSHDVVYGEELIKKVYDAVRASPSWNNTVLMVTYDEHGGFYDSVPTPLTGVPSPDGKVCTE